MKNKKILACLLLFLCLPTVYAVVDADEDGIIDNEDNCVNVHNPDQRDTNQDGFGNICDPDLDNDGDITGDDGDIIEAAYGLSPESPDWDPDADLNGDNITDISDVIIWAEMYGEQPGPSYGLNEDGDGWIDERDNCPDVANPDQADTDGNGIGDVCEKEVTTTVQETIETTIVETTIETTEVTTIPETTIVETTIVEPETANFTEFPEKVEVDLGDIVTVSGKFENTLDYDLYDVEFLISAEGLNPDWYAIKPARYKRIEVNDSKDISIDFGIPEDAEIYTYSIRLRASADSDIGRITFSKTFSLMLKEKIEIPSTTIPETTTTVPPEEVPLTGLYLFVKSYPLPIAIIIILIIVLIVWKVLGIKIGFTEGKKEYVYGKGWVGLTSSFKFFSIKHIKDLLTKW